MSLFKLCKVPIERFRTGDLVGGLPPDAPLFEVPRGTPRSEFVALHQQYLRDHAFIGWFAGLHDDWGVRIRDQFGAEEWFTYDRIVFHKPAGG